MGRIFREEDRERHGLAIQLPDDALGQGMRSEQGSSIIRFRRYHTGKGVPVPGEFPHESQHD